MYMEADKQSQNSDNKSKVAPLLPFQWKKGQSGNIMGRPKGKTMKDYAREYLSKMTDDERDEWFEGIDKDIIWKMAEGNPRTDTDITSGGKELPTPILMNYVPTNNITQENISNETQDTNSSRGNISVQDNINTPMVDTVSTDGQDTDTHISSSGINTTLETRSDERLQEHNAITPILERL